MAMDLNSISSAHVAVVTNLGYRLTKGIWHVSGMRYAVIVQPGTTAIFASGDRLVTTFVKPHINLPWLISPQVHPADPPDGVRAKGKVP
jgi:hypothetical protein